MGIRMRRGLLSVLAAGIWLIGLAGCGQKNQEPISAKGYASGKVEEATQAVTEEPDEATGLYMITALDTTQGTITFMNIDTGRNEQYSYTDGTFFLNKYGDHTSMNDFPAGRIVTIEVSTRDLKLNQIQISDKAWEYDEVSRFAIDESQGVFTIGDSKYGYNEGLLVFSDDTQIALSDLSSNDVLRIQGIDRKILSVSVTTGHGVIQLTNTTDVEGGYLSLNQKRYYEITADMQLEVPEGTYTLAVAGNGYGGSTDITVVRGEQTTVDVNDIKGEGPKYCTVTFSVDVENAVVYVDGVAIDATQPQQIQYGIHRLYIVADGYDTWSKRLFVNSAEAVIEVTLSAESTDSTETESTSDSETNQSSSETSSETDTEDATKSYISTLSEIIDTLTGSSTD